MGEAKRRKSTNTRVLERNPFCVYCGGSVSAVDVDHVPPLSIFDGRHRPREPLVGICKPCHEGTRECDAVASIMSRLAQSPENEIQRQDLRNSARALAGRFRELATELGLDRAVDDGKPGFLSPGPKLHAYMNRFSARMGFGFHYHCTGNPVPASGGALVRWYSNYDAIAGNIKQELFSILGDDLTLSQGRFNVASQFQYSVGGGDGIHVYFCSFRRAFATLAFVFDDPKALPDGDRSRSFICVPGFLKGEVA